MSIATRISILAVALVLITAGSITLLSYQQSKAGAEARLQQSVKAEVETKMATISEHIDSLRRDAHFLSSLPPISGIMRARQAGGIDPESGDSEYVWRQRLASIFTSFLHTKPHYLKALYIGIADQGREIFRVNNFGTSPEIVPNDQLQQKEQRPYFQKTVLLKAGEVFLSDINLDQEHGRVLIPHRPVMRAATPIFGMDGQIFGIVVVSRDMRHSLKTISSTDFKGDSDYLLNNAGDILSSGDPSQAFGFELGQRHLIQQTYPRTSALFIAGSRLQGLIEIGIPGFQAYFHKTYFDPQDSTRFIMLLDVHGDGPEAAVLSSNIRKQMLLYGLFIAIGIILAIMQAKHLSRPFVALSKAAQKIGEGALDVELPKPAGGEAKMLTKVFFVMLQKIVSREKALKEKVVELEDAHYELEHLATTDGLTGLYNRRFFNTRLEDECRRAQRYNLPLSLIIMDIDLFKQVNDNHGHQVGDNCLVFLAACISRTIRDVDMAVRYGGEEFVLILPQTVAKDATALGERLRKIVSETIGEPNRPYFTISSGVASWCPDSTMTSEALLKAADDALYEAKESGRNRTVLWQTEKLGVPGT